MQGNDKAGGAMSDKPHDTITLTLDGVKVQIDEGIAPLIEMLNRYGVKTTHSCEGETRGYIAIDKSNVDVFAGQINGKHDFSVNLRFPAVAEPEMAPTQYCRREGKDHSGLRWQEDG